MTGHDSAEVTWKVTFDETLRHLGHDLEPASRTARDRCRSREVQTGSSYTRTQALAFDGGCVTSTVVDAHRSSIAAW